MRKLLIAVAAASLVAGGATAWADDDDDDAAAPAAASVGLPGMRSIEVGPAGLMERSNRTDLDEITLTAGALKSAGTYNLDSGGYYRIKITSDGTQEQAIDHPMKHVLARAVGVQENLQIDAVRDTIVTRDIFLLCSDGLHGVISEQEIAATLRAKGRDACDDLIAACLDKGAPDNVTVTVVATRAPTLLALNGAMT